MEKVGPVVRASASRFRSQGQNRGAALEQLARQDRRRADASGAASRDETDQGFEDPSRRREEGARPGEAAAPSHRRGLATELSSRCRVDRPRARVNETVQSGSASSWGPTQRGQRRVARHEQGAVLVGVLVADVTDVGRRGTERQGISPSSPSGSPSASRPADLTISGARDASATHPLHLRGGKIRDVQIEERARRRVQELVEDLDGHLAGGVVVDVLTPLDRDGQAREPELRAGEDGADRARVQDAAPDVGAGVDAREDEVRLEVEAPTAPRIAHSAGGASRA